MNLVIRNLRLIDGTGAEPVPSVSVDVRDGIIHLDRGGNASPAEAYTSGGHQRRWPDTHTRDD